MTPMDWIGLWCAGLITLAIYSFLYKDNPAYKLAEHIFIGVSAGYTVCITWHNIIMRDVVARLKGHEWITILPIIMGLLMYTRFSKKYRWLSRFSMAFVVGAGAGIGVPNMIQAYLIRHTQSTLNPIYVPGVGIAWNDLCIMVGVVTVLIYFFFSVEHKGLLKWLSSIGIVYLMVYFGASFGYTIMARVSLVIGRMRFIIIEWITPVFEAIRGIF